MRQLPVLLLLGLLTVTGCAPAASPGAEGDAKRGGPGGKSDIFGWDDRREVHHFPEAGVERRLASATAAMFFDRPFEQTEEGTWIPQSEPELLGDKNGLCEDEPFVDQPTINACTAFLVGEDLVVTAGHCIRTRSCDQLTFAFDYAYFAPDDVGTVPELRDEDYFECAEIVENHTDTCEDDWALVRLDRPTGREPLEYRRTGAPEVDTPLLTAGFPLSIPMKVAGSARLREIDELKLHTDLDIFGGNSGSPVVDARTARIEGIHVCSEPGNTMPDPDGRGCNVSLECGYDRDRCSRWAEATRITRLSAAIDSALGLEPPTPDAGVMHDGGIPHPDGGGHGPDAGHHGHDGG